MREGRQKVALTVVDVLAAGLEPAVALVHAHAVVVVGLAFHPQLRVSALVMLRGLRLIVPEPRALAVGARRDGVGVVLLPAAVRVGVEGHEPARVGRVVHFLALLREPVQRLDPIPAAHDACRVRCQPFVRWGSGEEV